MVDWSEAAFVFANGLSGRSYTLDALLALVVDSPVAKAGPIICCFAYAWWQGGDADRQLRRRRLLCLTLLALFLIAPITKMLSADGFAPRPLVRDEQVYVFDSDGPIRPLVQTQYRPPATGEAAMRYENLAAGKIDANDLNSFPSDHAALFMALAFGIFLASKRAGSIALAWTVFCTLGARVITGLHWPADVVAGSAIGVGSLLIFLGIARALPLRITDLPVHAAQRWPGLAAAVLTLALFEVANAMNTLKPLSELAASAIGLGPS